MEDKRKKKGILQCVLYSVLGEKLLKAFLSCVRTQYKSELCLLSFNMF